MGKHSSKRFGSGTSRSSRRGIPVSRGASGTRLSVEPGRRRGPLEEAPVRLRAERERRSRRNRRIAIGVALSMVAAAVLAAAGVFVYLKHIESTMQRTVGGKKKLEITLADAKPQEPYNLLILGYDKRPKDTQYRADTMILARVDPKTKQVWMLSLPRDLRVDIPGYGHNKLNSAFVHGQEKLAVKTVEKLTGEKVNHFVGVNFTGFKKVVDAMGGVWVDVPTDINDIKADRSKGHRAARIDAGYQLLDGEHALTFVRTRDFPDADFSRMKNQQAFFRAVADQIATKTSVAKLPRIVSAMAPYMSTDMGLVDMIKTAQALKGAGSKNVYTATLPGEWRSPFVWLDEEKADELLRKFRAGEPFEPKPSTEGSATAEASATPEAQEPEDITITIRNGANINGVAKQASSILKARGFEVVEVGNANQPVYDRTLIVYGRDAVLKDAELVAAALPRGTRLVESRGMYSFDSDILVVIGKDWDVSKVPVTPIQAD